MHQINLEDFERRIKVIDAAIEVMRGRGSTAALENEKTTLILNRGTYERRYIDRCFEGIAD
jgi:hypothetical protein